ncbi:NAD(P)-dependent dehydrogenase (short-subunit alcohol dehydrogenase family) [Phenylobacterium haematophilum]|jgi:NADP-dependent 3-hydroxy acid dehydrogenase YdfG|uniref:D-xylose 1-dehydrogenase n=1 Tax=Phenylobacterium haematophilum TaxID=98513 RepID=A0A840A1P2_9CAUL|nr:SDR family oxidoreductase [Phenylobacterium haematophilum]MBB3892526.1 NAD(P)-dependent dehydrogenase (short-subunit alcohol dehydrogenase family) [Phenylobacterium haematophilum]
MKVALVTGAGSGIGRASAIALAEAGYSLVLVGRRADKLEETAAALPGETLIQTADIADETAVDAAFEATRARFGRLDVLFNNAGVSAGGRLEDLSLDAWKRVVDANLTGAFLCTRAAFRLMKAQDPRGGRIINNGSISAHAPRPYSVAYTATKHAITGLTRSASLEGRAYDIACGQIDIGNAATEMTLAMAKGVPQADGSFAPEPLMDVKAVADAVAFMAGLPLDANVQFMTVMATKMPFIGRG